MVSFQQRSKQEMPDQPKAATWDQVRKAITKTKDDAQAMALLLGWLTAARLRCIRRIQKDRIIDTPESLSITFVEGKTVKLIGPYTVHAQPIPPEFRERWQAYLATRQHVIFPRRLTGNDLKEAIRKADPQLEQRSLRRGALQTMAANGVSEETLMRYSGHTQVGTLRRYLNWNAINSKVQKEMVGSGKVLVRSL